MDEEIEKYSLGEFLDGRGNPDSQTPYCQCSTGGAVHEIRRKMYALKCLPESEGYLKGYIKSLKKLE